MPQHYFTLTSNGSVSYEWTDANGTQKRGLLEKEFPYQGECEYTLTAVE